VVKETESREELPTVARPKTRYAALPAFVVTVATGADSGKRLVFDANQPSRILLGTSPSCELRLTDREVSRRHAALEITGPDLHLVDLGSTNGTFVNGLRIVEAIVAGGESIQVGGTTLTLEPKPNRDGPEPSTATAFGRLVGASLAMRRLYPFCERLAKSDVPVLIEGETGTGKELLAEALHEASPRASSPFVVFDCSAVTPSLVESQLFGHERGAFTGAATARKGVFELADGGTLFIDEIGDLELSLQARLLRAIEKGEVCRLGSERWQKVNVRILAATRRDLDREVQNGRFRDDLFFRLAVARLELPALRRRHGDVGLLARHFWDALGGAAQPIPYELFERFEESSWPGNVRELYNAVARALALGELAEFERAKPENAATKAEPGADWVEEILDLELPLPRAKQRMIAEFERRYVERVLGRTDGDAQKAAAQSGIARRYFNLLRARHGARSD
jgi:two-component system, NtrC family, response regulator HydG